MIFFYSYHLQANLPCFLWIFLIYCPLIFFPPPHCFSFRSVTSPVAGVLPLGTAELLSQQTAWPMVSGGYNAERPPNDKLKWFLLWNDVQGAGRRSTPMPGGAAPPQRCGWCQEMEPSSLGTCHTDMALSPSSGSPCPAALCPHQYQLVHNSLRYL